MRKKIYATFFVVMALSFLVSCKGTIYGKSSSGLDSTQDSTSEERWTLEPSISPVLSTPASTSMHPCIGGIILAVGCMLISAAIGAVVSYFVYEASTCNRDSPWISDPSFSVLYDGDRICVGDHFRVEGSVNGYAGLEGHTNQVTIKGRAGSGTGSKPWDWEDTTVEVWTGGGPFDLGFEFSGDQGEGFQAASEGTLVIEVWAEVTGYKGTGYWCWDDEEVTDDSGWIRKYRTIYSPYEWSVNGPNPSEIYHPPHPQGPTTTQLTSEVTSKTTATLDGYAYVDDAKSKFRLTYVGASYTRAITKSCPHDPHIVSDKIFYFENIKVETWIVLDNGQVWTDSKEQSDKAVTCLGSVELQPYLDIINWGEIVFDAPGYEGDALGFEFMVTGSEPSGVSYEWDFDDGSSATGPNPSHTYQDNGLYNVSVTAVWGSHSLTELAYVNVDNLHPSISSASVVGDAGQGVLVSFISSATDPGGNDVLTYTWDFGDGQSSTGASVQHAYSLYGAYRYVLTVTDDDYGFNVSSGIIWIQGTSPVANAGGPYTCDEGCPIQFDGSGSTYSNPGGALSGWIWDFGDGTSGYGRTTNHVYINDGIYTANLTVMDDNALISSISTTVTVNDVDPEFLRIAFDYETQYRIRFTTEYNTPNPFINLTYTWDFGDSVSGSGRVVDHDFSSGVYDVTLTVDDGDSSVQKTEQISIPAAGKVSSFSLDVTPSHREIGAGEDAIYYITATSINNFSSPLSMTVAGLPSDASGVFKDIWSEHPYTYMTLYIRTWRTTQGGEYTLTIRGQGGGKIEETTCKIRIAGAAVGGEIVPVNKLGLLTPYIGLASTIIVAVAAAAIYVKRVKHRKEKQ